MQPYADQTTRNVKKKSQPHLNLQLKLTWVGSDTVIGCDPPTLAFGHPIKPKSLTQFKKQPKSILSNQMCFLFLEPF